MLVREREFYAPTELFIAEHACLNFGLRLEPRWIWPYDLPALSREAMPPEEFNILLERLVRDPFIDRTLTDRLVLPQPTGQTGVVRIAQEAAPNPDSRVTLGEDRDAFGLSRVALDWRISEIDVETMRTAVTAFGKHLAEQDIGRLQVADWLLADPPRFPGIVDDEVGGKHHIGTTRMSPDDRDRRRRRRLPRPRHIEPLHRRLERLPDDRPLATRPIRSPSSRCGSATTSLAGCKADVGKSRFAQAGMHARKPPILAIRVSLAPRASRR